MTPDPRRRRQERVLLALPFLAYTIPIWQAITSWQVFTGLDFRAYYTAGLMLRDGVRGSFYELATQLRYQQSWVPELQQLAQLMPFPYPAALALPLGVIAGIPPVPGYLAWTTLNAGALIVVVRQVRWTVGPLSAPMRLRASMLLLTLVPVALTLVQGQVSFVLLLAFLLAWREIKQGREVRAGLWLSLLALRPQLVILPALVLLAKARWSALAGLAIGLAGIALASLLAVGVDGLAGNVRLWLTSATGGEQLTVHPQGMFTWRSQVQLLLGTDEPGPALGPWVMGALACVTLLAYTWSGPWRSSGAFFDLQWATLVAATLFTSPHANLHDVALLVATGSLLARWSIGSARTWVPWLVGLGYTAAQLGPFVAPSIKIQAVVWVMGALVVLAARERRRQAFSSGA